MATPKSVAFQTLGCKLNFAETSSLARQFRTRGYHVASEDDPADIFVLNTCSVTDFADRKCRKAVRSALRRNPDARIVVTGCYAQLQPQEIADIPGVDLVLGAGHKFRIVDHVEALSNATDRAWVKAGEISEVTDFRHAHSLGNRTRAFLKVQDGCDYKCAFCTIPKARGKSRSPEINDILARAQQLEDQGIREIVLTGVNIGDFGAHNTSADISFHTLIRELEQHTAIPRFRISSIEPNLCHTGIIDFVSSSDRFMPHFHMPLQSGSDRILKLMRRRYRRALYRGRVDSIRQAMPHACIGADVIVGFPGETDTDFVDTYDFIRSLDVSYLHVFTYSERPGTPAAQMEEPVPMEVRRERHDRLHALSVSRRKQFYTRQIGQTREVLLEAHKQPGYLSGFTDNYVKVIVPEDESRTQNTIVSMYIQGFAPSVDAMVCG